MSCKVSPPTFATSRLADVHETFIHWLNVAPEKLGKEFPSPVTDQDGDLTCTAAEADAV